MDSIRKFVCHDILFMYNIANNWCKLFLSERVGILLSREISHELVGFFFYSTFLLHVSDKRIKFLTNGTVCLMVEFVYHGTKSVNI